MFEWNELKKNLIGLILIGDAGGVGWYDRW